MQKLTAIIPTGNEEHNIEEAIKSVSFADEVMVVDSFSTDRTVEIAKKHTDFVIQREYENSTSQKNWAIPQANYEWILLLDADERVTPKLKKEIQSILEKGTDKSAFWIRRQNHFMGKKVKYSGWQTDAVIRLFKRDECRYENKHVHGEIITEGKVSRLKNKLEHYTYIDLAHNLRKADRYSTWGAYDRVDKVKKVTLFHLGIKPTARFFRHYIIRGGILDGKVGFIISAMSAYIVFIRNLKLWRIQNGEEFKKD